MSGVLLTAKERKERKDSANGVIGRKIKRQKNLFRYAEYISAVKYFCLILAFWGMHVAAGQEALLADLEANFSTIKTVQTDFKQEKALKVFNRTIEMDGRVVLENPDKLAWRINSPIQYALVLNGDYALQWDEDSNKVQKQKTSGDPVFEEVIGQIEKWFSGDFKSLLDEYELTVLGEQPPVLQFDPKEKSMVGKVIKTVTIHVREDRTYVEQIVIEDIGGDKTSIKFVNTVLNEPVSPTEWEVKPNG